MIVIVDYKMGNSGSILNMFKRIGVEAIISSNVSDIEGADKLILPGVGAFDNGIKNLKDSGLIPVLEKKVIKRKAPILGICLGMQLLTLRSEEGCLSGLGWVDAETVRFRFTENQASLRIPHMGWNTVNLMRYNVLFENLHNKDARFYFAHSYNVRCNNEKDVLSTTHYGHDFVSSIQKGNIFGVQFHPEKSHRFGMQLLKNFCMHARTL